MLTLHGSQFKDAALIVASPPCQAYSYMAMPWKRAKAKAAAIRADTTGQKLADLNRLFDACFRIQRKRACAAGRHIPLIVENVRGAQPWVGRARWNFGSFYLWGDVPALMPTTSVAKQNREVLHRDPAKRNTILPQVVYREGDGIKGAGPTWAEVKSGENLVALDKSCRTDQVRWRLVWRGCGLLFAAPRRFQNNSKKGG